MPDGSYGVYPKPRRLATSEILDIVEQYRQAAINAIEAGNNKHKLANFALYHLKCPIYELIWG